MAHDKIDQLITAAVQGGAVVATTPAVLHFFSIQWWNKNSAGVIAICAVIGVCISFAGFIAGQWRNGNINKCVNTVFRRKKD